MAKEELENVSERHNTKQMVVRIHIEDAMHAMLLDLLKHLQQSLLSVEVHWLIRGEEAELLVLMRVLQILGKRLVDHFELGGIRTNFLTPQ